MTAKKYISRFTLSMITISAILSMREFPVMASVGLQSVFFYLIAAIMFLLPSAFVCAELGSAFPNSGGLYAWVRAGCGRRAGFLAMWMEWINNVISVPATLAVVAATVAYVGVPSLNDQPLFLFGVMMIVYWGLTLFNVLPLTLSSRLNVVGAIAGTLLPSTLIIILAILWLVSGHPSQINPHAQSILPSWDFHSMAFLVGVLSSYAGMQITGFHAPQVKNPGRSFPQSIFISTCVIFLVSLLSSLAIAVVVPSADVNYLSGIIRSFSVFLQIFHVGWAMPVLAGCLALGSIAGISAWVLGPARGIQSMAEDGVMPQFLAKKNRYDMPVGVLFVQGIIGTLLSSLFLWMPSVKSAFWVLLTLTSQLTVLMYVFLFIAALRLRYTQPTLHRPYRIPGPLSVIWILTGLAVTTCILGFLFSMVPPTNIHIVHESWYVLSLIAGDTALLLLPYLIFFRHSSRR